MATAMRVFPEKCCRSSEKGMSPQSRSRRCLLLTKVIRMKEQDILPPHDHTSKMLGLTVGKHE
jgi:hypothetical protein